jgi:hypothetical protein
MWSFVSLFWDRNRWSKKEESNVIEMYDNVFQTLSNLTFYKVNTLAKRCRQIIFIIFLLFNALCHHVMASEITISWTGQIEGITEFSDNSLPIGITVGDQVVGMPIRMLHIKYSNSLLMLIFYLKYLFEAHGF